MPVMNGFVFLEAYRRLDEHLRQSVVIVMLTSSFNLNDIEKLNDLVVSGFISNNTP